MKKIEKIVVKKTVKVNGRYALQAGQELPDPAYPDWLYGYMLQAGLAEYKVRRQTKEIDKHG